MRNILDILWNKHADIIRVFVQRRPLYEQLCSEVAFILKKRTEGLCIEIAGVTYRIKSLESFVEKIERKNYDSPLEQITDIAGVRLVYLFKHDLSKLKKIVRSNFEVVEEVSKTTEDVDRFGYDALHYIVRIGKNSSGARYDDLKDLLCEIQIRTVLQDSWAVIDHHLRYKNESQTPRDLRRKVHGVAALLENADDQFDQVSKNRSKYVNRLSAPYIKLEDMLDEEMNRDSLLVYLKKKFPEFKIAASRSHLSTVMAGMDAKKYPTLRHIDAAINQTQVCRKKYSGNPMSKTALAHLAIALGCVDSIYRKETKFGSEALEIIKDYCSQTGKIKTSGTKRSKSKESIKSQ